MLFVLFPGCAERRLLFAAEGRRPTVGLPLLQSSSSRARELQWLQCVGSVGGVPGLQSTDSVAVGMSLVALWHVGSSWSRIGPLSSASAGGFFLTTESPRKPLGESEFSDERYTFGTGISTSPFPAGRLCSATASFTSCLPSLPSGLEAIPLMWSCCCSVAKLCLTPGGTPDSSDPYCLSELAQNSFCYSKILLI